VPGRVPVLRQHDMRELFREPVDERHDRVAAGNRQKAARTEIVLHVDHDEDVAFADRQLFAHEITFCGATIRRSVSAASVLSASAT